MKGETMTTAIKEEIKEYFKDHYKHFKCYPMEFVEYDNNGEEKKTYSFEYCIKLIRKETA
jgi:hypothetical protein